MKVKLNEKEGYTIHEVVTDAVEIFEELASLLLGHSVPNLFKDELMSVGNYSTDKGNVKRIDVVFLVFVMIL